MEFNAGIFSFTGTRSSPLNMFRAYELTTRGGGTEAARAAAMACHAVFFLAFVQQYQGLERSGAVVNLTARRFRRRSLRIRNRDTSVRDKLTDRCRHSPDTYKNAGCGCGRADCYGAPPQAAACGSHAPMRTPGGRAGKILCCGRTRKRAGGNCFR